MSARIRELNRIIDDAINERAALKELYLSNTMVYCHQCGKKVDSSKFDTRKNDGKYFALCITHNKYRLRLKNIANGDDILNVLDYPLGEEEELRIMKKEEFCDKTMSKAEKLNKAKQS